MNEDNIIKKLKFDNEPSLKNLFDDYSRMVFNVAFRMLQNREDAEDVTQDVFLKVYKSLKHFRGESQISTWIYRITVNLSLNFQRKRKYRQWLSLDFNSSDNDDREIDIPDSKEENPNGIMERKETEQIVQAAINSLSEQQRVALLLHRYEGLSYEEIAKIMDTSVASVESRLHRAKISLTNKLLKLKSEL
ncbi:MAG: sigma-70 family RNA polymerase sigma factor [Ignavibacteriaceae bacterium]